MTTLHVGHTARETWLQEAVSLMSAWFEQGQVKPVPNVRVTCGWSKRPPKNSVAWCWRKDASADGVNEILVTPELDEPVRILGHLLHEMIHASDDCESQHKGYFKAAATTLGLEGKMTATVPGDALRERLEGIAAQLGPYPHAALVPTARPGKQATRMIKVVCSGCEYTVRTTQKWIDTGMPCCPCGIEMEVAS